MAGLVQRRSLCARLVRAMLVVMPAYSAAGESGWLVMGFSPCDSATPPSIFVICAIAWLRKVWALALHASGTGPCGARLVSYA
jgi:hypothetical protein